MWQVNGATIFIPTLYHTMKGHAQESCKIYNLIYLKKNILLIIYSIFSSSFKQDTYPESVCVFQNYEMFVIKSKGIVEYFLQFLNHFMG